MDKIIDLKEMYEKRRKQVDMQTYSYENYKERRKKEYYNNKNLGICVTCKKNKAVKNRIRCKRCNELHLEWDRTKRKKKKNGKNKL